MSKKYEITPKHEIELEKIKQKYIANSRRTDPMTEHDRDQMRVAMGFLEYPVDTAHV